MTRLTRRATLGAAASLLMAPAVAQSRTLTLVVPFPPGGSTDALARMLQPKLQAILGQNVIVENKAGAASALGAAYVAKGKVSVGGWSYGPGQMLVFGRGDDPAILAEEASTLLLLGGEPLGERFIWWNFVSSRRERIEQAKADWAAGRIKLPPNDNAEFVPLPPERAKAPSAQALS